MPAAELKAAVNDLSARMHRCGGRVVEDRKGRVEAAGRSLARIPDLVEMAKEMGMTIITTKYSMFLSCGRLYEAGLRGGGVRDID